MHVSEKQIRLAHLIRKKKNLERIGEIAHKLK